MCKTWRETGVSNVIGMLWNVEDDAAVQVGSTFYQSLIANPQMGPEEAMRQTRNKVATDRAWADGSWLAPVLYT
jgi:CHAT domain-containing protein